MTSSNGVGAFNATVRVNEPEHVVRAAREQRVVDCDTGAEHVRRKLAAFQGHLDDLDVVTERDKTKLAALKDALEAAEAEAVRARAEAQGGN